MISYFPMVLKGLPASLWLTVTSLCIALVMALIFTVILALRIKVLDHLIRAYLTVFTGTPLLVQFFIIYYGPGQFTWITQSNLWPLLSMPGFCAMLTLGLNSAAYTTQLFHGAVQAIPQGQWQACYSLGMTKGQALHVLLPYALKRSLSSYSNEVILVFKSTSLAYTITFLETMGYAQQIYGNDIDLRVYLVAGIIYLCVNGILTGLLRLAEKRALVFEHH